jgi:glycerophosphoryl diester phosphodiesterase
LLSTERVVAIAHRGGSKLRPENTIAAFVHALTLGVDGIECDVHLSKDGEPVVIHDPTLDRTTDAIGPVAALTASALAEVDAGFRFGEADGFPWRGRGCGIPRLATLLGECATTPTIVELKGDDPALADRVVHVVGEVGATERVILAGFSQRVLDRVRQIAPDLPTSASSDECRAAIGRGRLGLAPPRGAARVFQVPYRIDGRDVFGARFVRAARRRGVPVHAWIVDDPDDMARLVACGVTGLISDRPDRAVGLRTAAAPAMMRRGADAPA